MQILHEVENDVEYVFISFDCLVCRTVRMYLVVGFIKYF